MLAESQRSDWTDLLIGIICSSLNKMIGYWLSAFHAGNYVNLHSIYVVQGTPAVIFVF
jgi:uncharacterized BrkB/YihY/UPF0761 family membrane protein